MENFNKLLLASLLTLLLQFGLVRVEEITNDNESAEFKGTRQASPRTTNQFGRPLPSLSASQAIGYRGQVLFQDFQLMEEIASFSRERIPERSVHAKGAGAHGYFIVTHDISRYTRANFLNGVGKRTPVFVRMSTVGGRAESPDTATDIHGFATKFYTQDGIYDLMGLNTQTFPVRDPMLFSDMNHSRKRHPQTNLQDPNMFWDFNSLRPETTLNTLFIFSDIGRPNGYRRQDGFAVHAFKFVNRKDQIVFAKINLLTTQPAPALTWQEYAELQGTNPDYLTQDLHDAIQKGDFPCWNMTIQVMTPQQIREYPRNPFDATRIWRPEDVPHIPVGRLCLDRNPENFFAEVEQVAFCAANMVPGIEPSPDRLLAGRLFAYHDAQRYRLGVNNAQLPINKPITPVNTYIRDGFGVVGDNGGGHPNYFPNSEDGSSVPYRHARQSTFRVEGTVDRLDVREDEYYEAREFLEKDVDSENRRRMVDAIANSLKSVREEIRERTYKNMFDPISKEFGNEIRAAVEAAMASRESISVQDIPLLK